MLKHILNWRSFLIGCGGLVVLVGVLGLLGSGFLGFRLFQLEWKAQGSTNLQFDRYLVGFENVSDVSDQTGSLPFMAGVVIDLDGDMKDEVVLGGGRGQNDGIFGFDTEQGRFVDLSDTHGISKGAEDATMGGVSIDVDKDGRVDLLLARESGIWLYRNTTSGFAEERLPLDINASSTALSIAPGDINQDGNLDLYVSGYIKNDLVEGQTIFYRPYGGYSHLFLSNEDGGWEDASKAYGVWRQHNTFTAVFADFDNDLDSDLVIAQDTGKVEMYRNNGTVPLEAIELEQDFSYPMGIAAGNLDQDSLIDFYFSNVGHTLPEALLRGDLPKSERFNPNYMLFTNTGSNGFEDQAREKKIARLGFGWGTVAADMNLDGWNDLLVAQNYAKFGQPAIIHRYSGKILQSDEGKVFRPVEKRAKAGNRLFAISPLIGDFNGDNKPDLIWANLNGPAVAHLNTTPGTNSVTINLNDSLENVNAQISVELPDRIITRQVVPSQGLSSDQTSKIMIGIGEETMALRVSLTRTDGSFRELSDVASGTILDW